MYPNFVTTGQRITYNSHNITTFVVKIMVSDIVGKQKGIFHSFFSHNINVMSNSPEGKISFNRATQHLMLQKYIRIKSYTLSVPDRLSTDSINKYNEMNETLTSLHKSYSSHYLSSSPFFWRPTNHFRIN